MKFQYTETNVCLYGKKWNWAGILINVTSLLYLCSNEVKKDCSDGSSHVLFTTSATEFYRCAR